MLELEVPRVFVEIRGNRLRAIQQREFMEEIRGQATKVQETLARLLGRAFRFGMLLPEVEWMTQKRVKIVFRDSENVLRDEIELIGDRDWCYHTVTYTGDIPEVTVKEICQTINAQERINSKNKKRSLA